jgi:hypothetical protein
MSYLRLAALVTGALVAGVLASSASAGAVYRCTDNAGRTEYRDAPCRNEAGGSVRIEPNVMPGIDPRTMREAGEAIDARTAARVSEEQAARNRALASNRAPAEIKAPPTPYWMQGAFDP